MATFTETVLGLVKARLNRLTDDTTLDSYLLSRIEAARQELARTGINLNEGMVRDQLLLADTVAWQYSNRDKPGSMPDWLRLARRERWLQDKEDGL